jgi:hypothetical protein
MIEVLSGFYTNHYNLGIIAILMLLLAAFIGSKKNVKGVVVLLSIFLVYNLILYNKTKKDPYWLEKIQDKATTYDPVKELWNEKPADDDADKRK